MYISFLFKLRTKIIKLSLSEWPASKFADSLTILNNLYLSN